MSTDAPTFNPRAVRPVECLKEGWQLIKKDYWLFLGISIVGILIASLGPMGLLMGPAMCGIYLCLLRQYDGQPVTFDMLFKGFNYFVDGLIASLVIIVPTIVLLIPFYIVMFGGMFLILPQPGGPNQPPRQPEAAAVWTFLGLMVGGMIGMIVVSTLVQVLFMFAFPLIVDRGMPGWQAVKLSARSVWANFGGILGLLLLNMIISLFAALLCYFPAFLFMPISLAAVAVAYRRVFPAEPALAPTAGETGIEDQGRGDAW